LPPSQITRAAAETSFDVRTVLAFAAIYILWGSTYLAIRMAVETLPALFAAGIRFFIAGVILYVWGRSHSLVPSRRQWRNLWVLGALMFLAAYSGLFWAEKTLPSGVASVLVSTIPVWTFLLEVFFLKRARFRLGTGLAVLIGLGGVIVIASAQTAAGGAVSFLACLAILGSEISWSVGTVTSKLMDLPDSKQISAGAQMMCGGILLLVCALLAGELTPPPHVDMRAALATLYLTVVGSILAFTAYI
jgi:drug/metabolite transporter (DMT)-like permease